MGKKVTAWLLVWLFATGGLLFVGPEKSQACSCAAARPVQEELSRKTAIFSGKVIRVNKPGPQLIRSSGDPVEVVFEVRDVWKGSPQAQTSVYTAVSSASCGYERFTVNESYIVFASGPEDRLATGSCERTKPLASAAAELADLGPGYKPSPYSGADGARGLAFVAGIGGIVAATVLAAAIVLYRRRRRGGGT